jgi:hypothetical protein
MGRIEDPAKQAFVGLIVDRWRAVSDSTLIKLFTVFSKRQGLKKSARLFFKMRQEIVAKFEWADPEKIISDTIKEERFATYFSETQDEEELKTHDLDPYALTARKGFNSMPRPRK